MTCGATRVRAALFGRPGGQTPVGFGAMSEATAPGVSAEAVVAGHRWPRCAGRSSATPGNSSAASASRVVPRLPAPRPPGLTCPSRRHSTAGPARCSAPRRGASDSSSRPRGRDRATVPAPAAGRPRSRQRRPAAHRPQVSSARAGAGPWLRYRPSGRPCSARRRAPAQPRSPAPRRSGCVGPLATGRQLRRLVDPQRLPLPGPPGRSLLPLADGGDRRRITSLRRETRTSSELQRPTVRLLTTAGGNGVTVAPTSSTSSAWRCAVRAGTG